LAVIGKTRQNKRRRKKRKPITRHSAEERKEKTPVASSVTFAELGLYPQKEKKR